MDDGRLRLREGVIAQTLQGEMVLLDTRAGRYFDLNASGTRMLEELIAGSSAADVVATLQREFDVPGERVLADLATLRDALLKAGLVEIGRQG